MSGWVPAPPFSSSPNVTETIWRRARLPEKQILGMYANAQEYVILSHVAYHCLRHFGASRCWDGMPLKRLRGRISFKINSPHLNAKTQTKRVAKKRWTISGPAAGEFAALEKKKKKAQCDTHKWTFKVKGSQCSFCQHNRLNPTREEK